MNDLVLAVAVLIGVSLIALVVGSSLSRRWPERRTAAFAVVVLVLFLVYIFQYHGSWQMAWLLPFSNVIILGNWIPLGGAFLAGVTLGYSRIPPWRRYGLAVLLLATSGYSVACCFLGQLPVANRVTYRASANSQSRSSSCGPSCAAALLRHHGIDATEDELLNLCLTSHRGAHALGIYRGLRLKTAGTPWDVQVVTCTAGELLAVRGPLLLRVRLPAQSMLEADGKERTSVRRFEHAVLLMSVRDADHIQILDPAGVRNCIVWWNLDYLRECWRGEALRLVPRSAGDVRLPDPPSGGYSVSPGST